MRAQELAFERSRVLVDIPELSCFDLHDEPATEPASTGYNMSLSESHHFLCGRSGAVA